MNTSNVAAWRPGRYAAFDIGTVTCRMLIADVDAQGHLHECDREYAITNLGEGVDATGVLKPEAMQRVAQAITQFQAILATYNAPDHPIVGTCAVATSAARDARNAAEFRTLIEATGVPLAVIPGKREAALSFAGASSDFAGEIMVVDIGGGSTEVIVGAAGSTPAYAHSFDIGCRRVTEKFLHSDPPTPEELQTARTWIIEGMQPYFEDLQSRGAAPECLVAVAGTATTVVAVRDRMEVYDTARVHKAVVSRAQLDAVTAQLLVPLAQRRCVVGLDPGRAPVIVAGMLILQAVLDLAHMDAFTVSETDILHGIILDEAAN